MRTKSNGDSGSTVPQTRSKICSETSTLISLIDILASCIPKVLDRWHGTERYVQTLETVERYNTVPTAEMIERGLFGWPCTSTSHSELKSFLRAKRIHQRKYCWSKLSEDAGFWREPPEPRNKLHEPHLYFRWSQPAQLHISPHGERSRRIWIRLVFRDPCSSRYPPSGDHHWAPFRNHRTPVHAQQVRVGRFSYDLHQSMQLLHPIPF